MIYFLVGPEKRLTPVPKQLLDSRILAWDYWFWEDGYSLASGNTASLPDCEPAAFHLFYQWLSSATIPKIRNERDQAAGKCLFDDMLGLYFLTYKFRFYEDAIICMDRLLKYLKSTNRTLGHQRVLRIYQNTADTSKLCGLRLFCARLAPWEEFDPPTDSEGCGAACKETHQELHKTFEKDVTAVKNAAVKIDTHGTRRMKLKDPRKAPSTDYHIVRQS